MAWCIGGAFFGGKALHGGYAFVLIHSRSFVSQSAVVNSGKKALCQFVLQ